MAAEDTDKDFANKNNAPLQQIFYGAPGTGKSNTIKRDVENKGQIHFRTTFHPDSDYSTFVGCYKPTLCEAPVRDGSGHEVAAATAEEKKRITYNFVPQAFVKAYCEAWNHYTSPEENKAVYLIIEEINRGNCAQIFGDLFQLLDRKDGFSEYPIDADEDLKRFLEEGTKKDGTPWLINKEGIKNGRLCLPPNLHIWATMNTSDQSLFPIDSAFKRRWDWKYIPINYEKEPGWYIEVNGNRYSWSDFLQKINNIVYATTESEDKMLGFFFVKTNDKCIDAEKFVNKVLFYLWTDVFKDNEINTDILKDCKSEDFAFHKFFNPDGKANEDLAETMLKNMEVKTIDEDKGTPGEDKGPEA